MTEYHVGCGIAGIYAGVLRNKNEWKDKTECTDSAIVAVRDYHSVLDKERANLTTLAV